MKTYTFIFTGPNGASTTVNVVANTSAEAERLAWAGVYAAVDAFTAATLRITSVEVSSGH